MTDSKADARALTDHIFFETTGLSADDTISQTQRALKGADGGELFMQHSKSLDMYWMDGKLRTYQPDINEGYSMRYVVDDAQGFSSSNDFREKALKEVAKNARGIRNYRQATGGMPLPLPKSEARLYTVADTMDDFSAAARTKILEETDHKARLMDPAISQVGVRISTEWDLITIIRQDGQRLDDVRPMTILQVSVTAPKDGGQETGSASFAIPGTLTEAFRKTSMDDLLKEAVRKLHVRMQAVGCPKGQMNVVLGPGQTAVLLHEAVGHGLEGDFNRKGSSAFSGMIGQRVAAKGVTVIDQGNLPGERGAYHFDDEGVEKGSTVMIEDGILREYIQDTMNARLMGVPPTGNGRRQSFRHKPMPRMSIDYILPGEHTLEEIIASCKEPTLYVHSFGSGQVDITNGKFVQVIDEAYMIRDGKIMEPVKQATLIGDGPTQMQNITMLGDTMKLSSEAMSCGKEGQSQPVGFGQPAMKIKGLTIGGTG